MRRTSRRGMLSKTALQQRVLFETLEAQIIAASGSHTNEQTLKCHQSSLH